MREMPKSEIGAIQALKRAAVKARELAERTKTPLYVFVDGRVVDLNPQSKLGEGESELSPLLPGEGYGEGAFGFEHVLKLKTPSPEPSPGGRGSQRITPTQSSPAVWS